jgi:hypothetical protein
MKWSRPAEVSQRGVGVIEGVRAELPNHQKIEMCAGSE